VPDRPLPIVSIQNTLFANPVNGVNVESTEIEFPPICHKTDPTIDEFELELAPLLPPLGRTRDQINYNESSIVLINRDDGFMSVGLRVTEAKPVDDEFALLSRFPFLIPHGGNNRIVPQ
jgi:hypothetical protein